jgi:nickel-dependent lactate racemase
MWHQWQDTFISVNHQNNVITGRNLLDDAVPHPIKNDTFIIEKLDHLGLHLNGVIEYIGKSPDQDIIKELTDSPFYFSI